VEEGQRLLVSELNHRVKNTLAIVNSIAAQTLHETAETAQARAAFIARIGALAAAHDVLTRHNWSGAQIGEIAAAVLEPHLDAGSVRIAPGGSDPVLAPQSAVALSIVLHELAANSMKYGALSTPSGAVDFGWEVGRSRGRPSLTLRWQERGGPPVTAPRHKGFGSRYIERGWAASGDTDVRIDYQANGLVCTLVTRRREKSPATAEW
jgi:two-component sensor histidine kinase